MKSINVFSPALFATGALVKAVTAYNIGSLEDTEKPMTILSEEFVKAITAYNIGSLEDTEKPMTILNEEFCQVYYILDDGKCEALRDSIRSEIRGSGTPTLELGDPSKKPVMFFFHGWPDTYAMWANQFAHFCGEDGEFACVAASMMDFNPDVPPADPSKLFWPLQADMMHEVAEELGLKDITLVIHDFGSIVGNMYVARHPENVKRVVNMDVGNSPGAPPQVSDASIPFLLSFQQDAIAAYRAKNDTMMQENLDSMVEAFGIFSPPCTSCKITPDSETPIGYRVGWMHEQFVNQTYAKFFDTPLEDWEFYFTPTWPDTVPKLFLWATEPFHEPSLLTWLDSRGDGSGHRKVSGDHWFMVRNVVPGLDGVSNTHAAMEEFFAGTFVSDAIPTTTGATAAPGATTAATTAAEEMAATTTATTAPPADTSGSMSSYALAVAVCFVVPLLVSMLLA